MKNSFISMFMRSIKSQCGNVKLLRKIYFDMRARVICETDEAVNYLIETPCSPTEMNYAIISRGVGLAQRQREFAWVWRWWMRTAFVESLFVSFVNRKFAAGWRTRKVFSVGESQMTFWLKELVGTLVNNELLMKSRWGIFYRQFESFRVENSRWLFSLNFQ